MNGILKKAMVATTLAASITGGMVATAGSASASPITIGCSSTAQPPEAFGPAAVRSMGHTSCGNQATFILEYRPNVNSPWQNVTTGHGPGNGYYQYVYASPVPTGYFRSSIHHFQNMTTYSADVYLVL